MDREAGDKRSNGQERAIFLWAVVATLSIGLLAFSQTGAWAGDEELHLVTAQLINAGKTPYLDFFYQQTPLYAYLNAGWMRVFGESWRAAHALSALLTSASIVLVAGFVFSRFPEPGWRVPSAMTSALLMGLSYNVIRFGTIGQAFGLCLFLIVAAFRLTIEAVRRPSVFLPAAAGLCAGAAAGSWLLSAPTGPILLLWMHRYNRSGNRQRKCGWFLLAAAIPFLPLAWLAAKAPRRVLFNIVEYELFYRRVGRTYNVTVADLKVLSEWLDSTQGLLLALLAAVGLLFLARRREWQDWKAELYLCVWLTAGLGVYMASPHPTFTQYFVLLIPFLSILASVGVYAIGSQVSVSGRPGLLVIPVIGLFFLGLAKTAFDNRGFIRSGWRDLEEVAWTINQVTPRDGLVYASEPLYFVTRRLPPPGMENSHAQHALLSRSLAASLHVAPASQVNEWLAAGRFDTAVLGATDPRIESLGLSRLYARRKEVRSSCIFWGKVAPSHGSR
ncbi:MAG: hypothetical protein HY238_18165 [Acidobacteria bacterium]|nr:hypothetical protein [Acidobacteriota bacterium]